MTLTKRLGDRQSGDWKHLLQVIRNIPVSAD
jgi:hypothetical protein